MIEMAEQRTERRLAAILAGDVAGYSRLMGTDEEDTLTRLNMHRREFLAAARHTAFAVAIVASAIGEELRAHFRPSNGLSPELRRLLRQFPCSSAGDLARRLRSREMWLTGCGLLMVKPVVWPKFRFGS